MATAEDTILAKLEWYRAGGESSERQWNDLRGIARVRGPPLDLACLRNRARAPRPESDAIAPRPKPTRALSDTERQTALVHLHSERFVDQAPHQVHATLLDEGIYVCSPRTMCRLLEEHGELRERRDQLRPPANSTSTPATDRTMKYRPEFPDRFGSLEDARAHGHGFFHWYNLQHHHSGIAMLTPHMVHYGLAADVLDNRQRVLTAAFQQHPECFVRKPPRPAPLPHAVWINPPKPGPPEGGETR